MRSIRLSSAWSSPSFANYRTQVSCWSLRARRRTATTPTISRRCGSSTSRNSCVRCRPSARSRLSPNRLRCGDRFAPRPQKGTSPGSARSCAMRAWLWTTVLSACLSAGSVSARDRAPRPPTADKINAATFNASGKPDPALLTKAQVLLDRAGFSPGTIDGRDGDNYRKALAAFRQQNSLDADGGLDQPAFDKLQAVSSDPAIVDYQITD